MSSTVVLTGILIHDEPNSHIQQGILTACLQALKQQMNQQHPQEYGRSLLCIISSCVLPPLLHVLGAGGYSKWGSEGSNTDVLMLQLVFLVHNLMSDDVQKTAYLHMLLPPMCAMLTILDLSSPSAQLCGKGITHIARTSPQMFRSEIMLLPEQSRVVLQGAMRAVLESMNQSVGINATQSAAGGGQSQLSASQGGVKKIDMSKYRGGS